MKPILEDEEDDNKNNSKSRSKVALFRRLEHLVFAYYVLYGKLTQRAVAISYLLLKVFSEESPISEKTLRMFQRIHDECLPSEHFQRKYRYHHVHLL